jgi:5-methylcytosine-specific restriction endonuclease McrA
MDKTCSKCGVARPIAEFKRRSDRSGGYRSACKICEKFSRKVARILARGLCFEQPKRVGRVSKLTPEEIAERRIRKAAQKREARILASKLRPPKPPKARRSDAERAAIKEAARIRRNAAQMAKRRAAGMKEQKKYTPEQREAVLKAQKAAERRSYKARKRGATGSHTAKDVAEIHARQRYKCAICSVSTKKHRHIDHIVPLALGGSNGKENLQILCPACNIAKGATHPVDFMQECGKLL